jgi:four helix bundle protein
MNGKKYDLEERLLEFAVRAIDVVENLPDNKACNYLGTQLLRSGTSPALNYGEAQAAESRNDFIHKFRIILKELRETMICTKMLHRKSWLPDTSVIRENEELIAIFVKSIATAKSRIKK